MGESEEKKGAGSSPKKRTKREKIGFAAGIAISVLLLFFLFRGLDWAKLGEQMKLIRPGYAVLVVFSSVISCFIRSIRWRYLLPSQHREIPRQTLFDALAVGALGLMVLPFRAGELVRAYSLSRWSKASASAAFASIVTERVFDVTVLLSLFALAATQVPNLPESAVLGAKALGTLAGAIAIVMVVAYAVPDLVLTVSKRVFEALLSRSFAEKLQHMAAEFVCGLRAIGSLKDLALVLFWSVALWLQISSMFLIGMWAFGENSSFIASTVLMVVVALAIAAPSAPGFIGTFQLGCVLALHGIYGYSEEFALAYSIMNHAGQMISIGVVGAIVLIKRGARMGALAESD